MGVDADLRFPLTPSASQTSLGLPEAQIKQTTRSFDAALLSNANRLAAKFGLSASEKNQLILTVQSYDVLDIRNFHPKSGTAASFQKALDALGEMSSAAGAFRREAPKDGFEAFKSNLTFDRNASVLTSLLK